jgi:hypothetical protein
VDSDDEAEAAPSFIQQNSDGSFINFPDYDLVKRTCRTS